MSKKTATILLLVVAIVWGAGFIATQFVLDAGFSPLELLTGRFFFGAITLSIIFKKEFKINKQELISGIVVGIILAMAFTLQTYGQLYTTPSIAAFLTAVYVVFVPFIDSIFFKTKIDVYTKIGACLTLFGIGFISLDSFSLTGNGALGIFLILLCAVAYALHIISVDKYTSFGISPIKISIIMLWVAFIITGICSITSYDNREIIYDINFLTGIVGMIFLGLFSTAFCFTAQNIAQKSVNPTKVSILLSLESVFGTLWSWLIFNEKFTLKIIIGFMVIFLGILIIETKPKLKGNK
ncbi:MAG: DMT family transporter [Lachnospirales bacterium]